MYPALIEGSEKITEIFGYWPSFHDAEIINFHLWRGDVDAGRNRYIFPVLTLLVNLWELTAHTKGTDATIGNIGANRC